MEKTPIKNEPSRTRIMREGVQELRFVSSAIARVRFVPGKGYEMKYGQRYFRFTEAAFMMAWLGRPKDLGQSYIQTAPRGTKGIEKWLERKGLSEFSVWSLTPTALKLAKRKRNHTYVMLSPKRGGWGGPRSGTGPRATNDLPELFEECVAEAREKCSEGPYLRYECHWERVNGRKAPKRLLAKFRERIK